MLLTRRKVGEFCLKVKAKVEEQEREDAERRHRHEQDEADSGKHRHDSSHHLTHCQEEAKQCHTIVHAQGATDEHRVPGPCQVVCTKCNNMWWHFTQHHTKIMDHAIEVFCGKVIMALDKFEGAWPLPAGTDAPPANFTPPAPPKPEFTPEQLKQRAHCTKRGVRCLTITKEDMNKLDAPACQYVCAETCNPWWSFFAESEFGQAANLTHPKIEEFCVKVH